MLTRTAKKNTNELKKLQTEHKHFPGKIFLVQMIPGYKTVKMISTKLLLQILIKY